MDMVILAAACAVGLCPASGNTPLAQANVSPPIPITIEPRGTLSTERWSGYIAEAARRFALPEAWIRAVMLAESGGNVVLDGVPTTSVKGAMGLMQLMPDTYAEMQRRYGLSDDPYDPRDNILAGAAFLRELYDRYGTLGFLAAYNAGPARYDAYIQRGVPLPRETSDFVAEISLDGAPLVSADPPSRNPRSSGLFAGPATLSRDRMLSAPSWRTLFVARVTAVPQLGLGPR